MYRTVTTLPVLEYSVAVGNYTPGRGGRDIDGAVLHTMVGTWTAANARFNNPQALVSVHYGVVLQDPHSPYIHWVDEPNTSYGCGNWPYNLSKLQIEHEDMGDYDSPRPDWFYLKSGILLADLAKFWNFSINKKTVLDHREVYATACPDALDTDRIRSEANNLLSTPTPKYDQILDSEVQKMVTLASVNVDKAEEMIKAANEMGFAAAEVKRSLGAPESRFTTNPEP